MTRPHAIRFMERAFAFLAAFAALHVRCLLAQAGDPKIFPLDDMGLERVYPDGVANPGDLNKGGLYGNGVNTRPSTLERNGLAQAKLVVPRLPDGTQDDDDGLIVFASIGFSHTRHIFTKLQTMLQNQGAYGLQPTVELHPRLLLRDGAIAGEDITDLKDPDDNYWDEAIAQICEGGACTVQQVQVIWMLEGRRKVLGDDAFPAEIGDMTKDFDAITANIKTHFPFAVICFVSPPMYQGYVAPDSNGVVQEPFVFETAFAVRELVLKHKNDGVFTTRPWLAWGPYLWATGDLRRSDGVYWTDAGSASDYDDATNIHLQNYPANNPHKGREKAARHVLQFLTSDSIMTGTTTTRPVPLFSEVVLGVPQDEFATDADTSLYGWGTTWGSPGNEREPRIHMNILPTIPSTETVSVGCSNAPPNALSYLFFGTAALAWGSSPLLNGYRLVDPSSTNYFVTTFTTDGTGFGQVTIDTNPIPNDVQLVGLSLFGQVMTEVAPSSAVLSPGLQMTLGD